MLYSSHLWCHTSNFRSLQSLVPTDWSSPAYHGISIVNLIAGLSIFLRLIYSIIRWIVFIQTLQCPYFRFWFFCEFESFPKESIFFLRFMVFFAFKCLSISLICYLMRIFQYISAFWWRAENSQLSLTIPFIFFGMVIGSNVFTRIFFHCGIFGFPFNRFPFNIWKTMYSLLRIRHNLQISYFTTDGSLS